MGTLFPLEHTGASKRAQAQTKKRKKAKRAPTPRTLGLFDETVPWLPLLSESSGEAFPVRLHQHPADSRFALEFDGSDASSLGTIPELDPRRFLAYKREQSLGFSVAITFLEFREVVNFDFP